MQNTKKSTSSKAKTTRVSVEQRKTRRQQVLLAVVGIVVILAMILSLAVKY